MPRNKINNPSGINGPRSDKTEFHFRSVENARAKNKTPQSVMDLAHYKKETVPMLVPIRTQFPQINPIDPQYPEVYQPFMVQASRCETTIPILTQAIDLTIKHRREIVQEARERLAKRTTNI